MELLTPATSHTCLAGPGRLRSNLMAGVAQHRHMAERFLASSCHEAPLQSISLFESVSQDAPKFGS